MTSRWRCRTVSSRHTLVISEVWVPTSPCMLYTCSLQPVVCGRKCAGTFSLYRFTEPSTTLMFRSGLTIFHPLRPLALVVCRHTAWLPRRHQLILLNVIVIAFFRRFLNIFQSIIRNAWTLSGSSAACFMNDINISHGNNYLLLWCKLGSTTCQILSFVFLNVVADVLAFCVLIHSFFVWVLHECWTLCCSGPEPHWAPHIDSNFVVTNLKI